MQRFLRFEPAMISPFILPPPPDAQAAAAEVIAKVHDYMGLHPESELHRQGKMFGVLVYDVTSNDQSPGASSRQTGGAASAEKGYYQSPIKYQISTSLQSVRWMIFITHIVRTIARAVF